MRTIHFINSNTKIVEQEVIDFIISNQLKTKFEAFTDLNQVNYLVINLSEILYID